MSASRPTSLAYLTSAITHPPSLEEILSNTAPAPWTLAAFMAFLHQNHCSETLEFIMEAKRYSSAYLGQLDSQDGQSVDSHLKSSPLHGNEHLWSIWVKLMNSFIVSDAPRELNLPARVRDRLLGLPTQDPPHPSELDSAVSIIYELMNDSVLGPFLESLAPPPPEDSDECYTVRQGRTKHRISRESRPGTKDELSRSPKTSFLPLFGYHRSDHHGLQFVSSSSESPEAVVSDDMWTSPREEPMTPPSTPPTSDWGFHASPGTLQRAINAHNTGWKKMGQKLGLSRRSGRDKRSITPSITSGGRSTENSHSSSGYSSSYPC